MSEEERPGDAEPVADNDDGQRRLDAGSEASQGESVDEGQKRAADYRAERDRVRQVLEQRWRCRIIGAKDAPFDWYFIRNDTVAGVASYTQHRESGNVLIPVYRWQALRQWSTMVLRPHFWVVDFLSQGIRYKMFPQHSGVNFEMLAKDDEVYVTIPQNTFDILKEEA